MTTETIRSLKSYVLSADYHRPQTKREQLPFVTLSRQAGAGGISVGKLLRDKLEIVNEDGCKWMCFDRDLLREVINEHDLPQDLAGYMDETQYNAFLKWMDDAFSHKPTWSMLVRKTSETIRHLAHRGHVIIVGRGSSIVTRSLQSGVHVRLVGSPEKRLLHLREYYRLDLDEAQQVADREDRGRAQYFKDHFGRDIDDACLYDLVLNTDLISYERAADIICDQVQVLHDTSRKEAKALESR